MYAFSLPREKRLVDWMAREEKGIAWTKLGNGKLECVSGVIVIPVADRFFAQEENVV